MNEQRKLQFAKIISIINFATAGLLFALPQIMQFTNFQLYSTYTVFLVITIQCCIFTGSRKNKIYDDSRLPKINRNQLMISMALQLVALTALVLIQIKFNSPSLYSLSLKCFYFLTILSFAYQFFIFFKKDTVSIVVSVFALICATSGFISIFRNSVFVLIMCIMLSAFSINFLIQRNV